MQYRYTRQLNGQDGATEEVTRAEVLDKMDGPYRDPTLALDFLEERGSLTTPFAIYHAVPKEAIRHKLTYNPTTARYRPAIFRPCPCPNCGPSGHWDANPMVMPGFEAPDAALLVMAGFMAVQEPPLNLDGTVRWTVR